MKVYVGCSLTHAPDAAKKAVEEFKLALREKVEVLEFLGLEKGTAADVYVSDLGQVETADVVVAFVVEPSIGVGMEIMRAIELKKPLLCLLEKGRGVTRMVRGAAELGLLSLEEYASSEEALSAATLFITRRSPASAS